jgi:hypothetical protein
MAEMGSSVMMYNPSVSTSTSTPERLAGLHVAKKAKDKILDSLFKNTVAKKEQTLKVDNADETEMVTSDKSYTSENTKEVMVSEEIILYIRRIRWWRTQFRMMSRLKVNKKDFQR